MRNTEGLRIQTAWRSRSAADSLTVISECVTKVKKFLTIVKFLYGERLDVDI